jgi:hypothetical protein
MKTGWAGLVLLCAVAGCSSSGSEPPTAARDTRLPDVEPAPAPAIVPWELSYRTADAADLIAATRVVTIKSDGTITVHTDLELTGEVTVTPEELAPLVRLLADDGFRSLPSGHVKLAAGPVTSLFLTGEHSLDARWSVVPGEALPVIAEVLRLIPLAGSRPVFSVWISTRTSYGTEEIRISSAGRVERSIGPDLIGRMVLPAEALDPLRALLAAPGVQYLAVPFEAGARIGISVSGEFRINAWYAHRVPEPARGLYQEALRIAAAVPASVTPESQFSVEYTRRHHGTPLERTVSISAPGGSMVIDEVGQGPREKRLAPDDVTRLARALDDPLFALAPSVEAFSDRKATRHTLHVTGDLRHHAKFEGEVPPAAEAVIELIDQLAQ